eukprot:TRINITY_DN9353_c0_g1_i2.p1 TRINITY_DN9353_c0_g1~~TRINITY_DN9353_c0_g1_i2.p1  ORF type:complete len:167 (+),score=37.38 TRINITY_DN9353_c0_g1_i2:405-905(+)
MPELARYLGEAKFTSELSSLFTVWLMDPVFSVRDGFAASFNRLSSELGIPWTQEHVIPQLQTLLAHKNYLYRISAMLCARTLCEVSGPQLLETHLIPMVVQMSQDPVPNVRFNAAKTIKAMHISCANSAPEVSKQHLVPALFQLLSDQDPDVKFYAQKAIGEIQAQ